MKYKIQFKVLENRCYYFGTFSKLVSLYHTNVTSGVTYAETQNKCKTVFGRNIVGKIVEPRSYHTNKIISEEARRIWFHAHLNTSLEGYLVRWWIGKSLNCKNTIETIWYFRSSYAVTVPTTSVLTKHSSLCYDRNFDLK